MEEKILNVLKEVLEVNDIDITVSQENCEAWDSLRQLNVVLELEDAFNVSFEPEEIAEMKDIPSIKRFIEAKL